MSHKSHINNLQALNTSSLKTGPMNDTKGNMVHPYSSAVRINEMAFKIADSSYITFASDINNSIAINQNDNISKSLPDKQIHKKRRSKKEMNSLHAQIIRVLEHGYDLSSVAHILSQRRDNIANRLIDDAFSQGLGNFPQTKKIMRCPLSISKLFRYPPYGYIEIVEDPRGGIHLTPVDLANIRKNIGIED